MDPRDVHGHTMGSGWKGALILYTPNYSDKEHDNLMIYKFHQLNDDLQCVNNLFSTQLLLNSYGVGLGVAAQSDSMHTSARMHPSHRRLHIMAAMSSL